MNAHFSGLPREPRSMRCLIMARGCSVVVQCALKDMPAEELRLHWMTATWWRRLRYSYRWSDTTGHFVCVRAASIDGWCWAPVEDVPIDTLQKKTEKLVDEMLRQQGEGEEWKGK